LPIRHPRRLPNFEKVSDIDSDLEQERWSDWLMLKNKEHENYLVLGIGKVMLICFTSLSRYISAVVSLDVASASLQY